MQKGNGDLSPFNERWSTWVYNGGIHVVINNGQKPNEDGLKALNCVCLKWGQWVFAMDFFQKMVGEAYNFPAWTTIF